MTPLPSTIQNPQTPADQIAEIQNRFARLPALLRQRVDTALMHDSIELAANLLFKAGESFTPADLYEYRKTLFPSSVPDPGCVPQARNQPQQPHLSVTAQNTDEAVITPASSSVPDRGCGEAQPQQPQLHEARQRLVQLLAARSADARVGVKPPPTNAAAAKLDSPSSTHSSTDQPMNPTIQQSTNPHSSIHPPIQSSIDPPALLSALRDLIQRHVVLPDMAAETLALWVVHTYAFTLRQVTTYIGVVSPEKRCGKTTLLELLGFLAHEAVAAANISPSALFRVSEESQPTLIIDEADTFMQARDEMAGILNAGYRKGNSYVIRVAEGKPRRKPSGGTSYTSPQTNPQPSTTTTQLVRYSCWCPKVMAAIGRLPDTLADRCIIITMQRKMPGEKCERLRELNAADYRQRCADFVREHSDAIAHAQPTIPSTLNDRAADIWEPLLAIADLAGGDWPRLARHAAEKLNGAYDDEVTLIGYFLKDLRNYMVLKGIDRILSRDLVAYFNPRHDRPWEDLRRGREINEYWLGHKMSEMGIRSKTIRIGEVTGKGYLLEEIEAAFRRYVPDHELHSAKAPEKGGGQISEAGGGRKRG